MYSSTIFISGKISAFLVILSYLISFLILLCLSNNQLANIFLVLAVFASSLSLIVRKGNFPEKELAVYSFACILVLAIMDILRGSFEPQAFFVESKIYLLIPLVCAAKRSYQLASFLEMCLRSFSTIFLVYSLYAIIVSGFSLRFSGYAPISIFPINYASVCVFILLASKDAFAKCVWSIFLFFSGSLSAIFGLGVSILFKYSLAGSQRSKESVSLVVRIALLAVVSIVFTLSFFYIAEMRGRDVFLLEELDRYMIYVSYFESFLKDASNNLLYLFFGYGSTGGSHFMDYIADDAFFAWMQSFYGLYGSAVGYLLHSDYLRLFNLGGIFVLASFLYLLYKSVVGRNANFYSLHSGLQYIILFIAFQSILNSVLYTSAVQIVFWVCLGSFQSLSLSNNEPLNNSFKSDLGQSDSGT